MLNVPSEIQSKFGEKYACLKKVYEVGVANERGIYQNADGSWQCHYAPWVQISILPDGRCFETHGAICERWYKENGWIGLPISDEEDDGPDGRISHFEHGDIRWSRTTNTCEVRKREVPLDIQKQVEPVEVQKPEESAEVLAHLEEHVPEDIQTEGDGNAPALLPQPPTNEPTSVSEETVETPLEKPCTEDVGATPPVETRRTLFSIIAGWPIVSDVIDRIRIAGDRNVPLERRIFAALEAVFFPVSALTVVAMFVLPVLGWCGVPVSRLHQGGLGWAMTILTSAAIGYLTNWIAIEMLFKPYYPTKRHPFAWITCGIWRQGLVPKNKNQIADVMGKEVAQKLLRPEQLANDLCAMAGEIIRNPNIISSLRNGVQRAIAAHDQEIAAFLAPKIETALREELNRLVTVDKVEEFWTAHIEPRLQSAETRDQIATIVIGALEKRSSSLASKAKPLIVGAIEKYVREGPLLVRPLAGLAGLIADVIVSRDFLEEGLRNWLKAPETVPALRDELLHFVGSVRDFVKSDESRGKIGAFVEEIRSTFKDYVSSYLEKNLANVTGRLLNSESFWNSVTEMIPKFQPEIERLIRTEGMPIILEKLDIQGRIKTAVDKMDVKEFHGMINEVAAQHLGAIQVLGFILGAAAGALTRAF